MSVKMKQYALDYGKHFGKYDLERWGDFGEMSYMHGVSYGLFTHKLSDREKGLQMLPGFPKLKAGLQDCYFDHEFKRIFIGEAYLPLYKLYAKQSLQQAKKFLTPEGFTNPGFPKKHSTPGDHYGTFSGKYDAFSAKTRPPPKKGVVLRNFYTSPGKKGGFGYAQICINRYPEYKSGDKYDQKPPPGRKYTLTNPPFKGPSKPSFFDSNPYPEPAGADTSRPLYNKLVDLKWLLGKEFMPVGRGKPLGGHKGGGFSPFPEYLPSRYIDPWRILRGGPPKPVKLIHPKEFLPQVRNKTRAMFSVVNLNVDKKVTADNFTTIKPITFTREFFA